MRVSASLALLGMITTGVLLSCVGRETMGSTTSENNRFSQTVIYVPDAETAIRIAEAVFLPIYGEKVYKERPFVAELNADGIWTVHGTLPSGTVGGTAMAQIRKTDGKILLVTHGK